MEKFAGEAWLTFVVAGLMAIVLVPLAFLLNSRLPRTVIRGIPERWAGLALVIGSLLMMFVLPGVIAELAKSVGLLQFLDSNAEPTTMLRPKVSTANKTEWTQITNSLRHNYSTLAALPTVLFVIWLLKKRRIMVVARSVARRSSWHVLVYEIILCWAVYGLVAILLNCVIQYLYQLSGWSPAIHPIAKVGIFDGTGGWIIGLGACLVAPFTEELIFRRWLLPWTIRKTNRLMMVAFATLFITYLAYLNVNRVEVLTFGLLLVAVQVGLYAFRSSLFRLHRLFRSRTFSANWATSSLFAMMHGSIWPSPMALMLLSMGLGFLVVRTGRWWTAFLCHSLFNFTSLLVLYASQGAFGPQFKIALT